ncbi:MAG: replication initiator protein A [Oscillospiraceae bacterium]|nr:replication initiator protein A [Oscillospiraceae bacterium]
MNVYKITDLIKCDFYKIPKAFYSNPKYIKMSAEAKLAYAMLYDRLSLSQKNGWINDRGEVYLTFKRKTAAEILNVGEKKVTAIFKELSEKELILDVCVGQGKPNRIYIVKPELSELQARKYTDKENDIDAEITGCGMTDTDASEREEYSGTKSDGSRTAKMTVQEPQKRRFKNRENDGSRTAKTTVPEQSEMRPNKTNISHTNSNISQSVMTDRQLFEKILSQCQLEYFDEEIQHIFYDAVERLFYCKELNIGSSVLPGENVRSRLCELDYTVLENALHKMHENKKDTKNPTGYVMSVIFNCLTEGYTETHLNPYLNHLRSG